MGIRISYRFGKVGAAGPDGAIKMIGAKENLAQKARFHNDRQLCARLMGDQALNDDPQPQVLVALGLVNTNPRPMTSSLKSIVVPLR